MAPAKPPLGNSTPKRIATPHFGAFGDIITVTALFQVTGKTGPAPHIDLTTVKVSTTVLYINPDANSVITGPQPGGY